MKIFFKIAACCALLFATPVFAQSASTAESQTLLELSQKTLDMRLALSKEKAEWDAEKSRLSAMCENLKAAAAAYAKEAAEAKARAENTAREAEAYLNSAKNLKVSFAALEASLDERAKKLREALAASPEATDYEDIRAKFDTDYAAAQDAPQKFRVLCKTYDAILKKDCEIRKAPEAAGGAK